MTVGLPLGRNTLNFLSLLPWSYVIHVDLARLTISYGLQSYMYRAMLYMYALTAVTIDKWIHGAKFLDTSLSPSSSSAIKITQNRQTTCRHDCGHYVHAKARVAVIGVIACVAVNVLAWTAPGVACAGVHLPLSTTLLRA